MEPGQDVRSFRQGLRRPLGAGAFPVGDLGRVCCERAPGMRDPFQRGLFGLRKRLGRDKTNDSVKWGPASSQR